MSGIVKKQLFITAIRVNFLPSDAMLSTLYAVDVYLCVCVCVCHTPVLYQNG